MKSTEFLQAAIEVQAERGKQYDKPSGERSMAATVSAFNCITGSMLEESDGWMFLGLLKLVRQAQNPEKYHHDSALDFVAYASLYAEAASEQCGQLEAQNAHTGYKEEFDPQTMPIMDLNHGWIECHGEKCPVARGTLIDVKDRDGEIHNGVEALDHFSCLDYHWTYRHPCSSACEIIAYRLSPTSTAK